MSSSLYSFWVYVFSLIFTFGIAPKRVNFFRVKTALAFRKINTARQGSNKFGSALGFRNVINSLTSSYEKVQ